MNNFSMGSARERRFVVSTVVLVTLCALGVTAALAMGRLAGTTLLTSLMAGTALGLSALAVRRRPEAVRQTR